MSPQSFSKSYSSVLCVCVMFIRSQRGCRFESAKEDEVFASYCQVQHKCRRSKPSSVAASENDSAPGGLRFERGLLGPFFAL